MNIFLTGEIQVGKSTIIKKYISLHGYRVGGFNTIAGAREADGSSNVHIVRADGTQPCGMDNIVIRRYGLRAARGFDVFPEIYDTLGVKLLTQSSDCDLIVMDELGPKENDALLFQRAVLNCLAGAVPVLGVLMKRQSSFLDRVRSHPNVKIIEVTPENRESILRQLPPLSVLREEPLCRSTI